MSFQVPSKQSAANNIHHQHHQPKRKMFSFHKPKIYRSNLGCCICKAKSSSSRFTDSNKYENEFERCFRIQEKRSGEICNACVLLVKRWKKLSPENKLTKHWHHVVDARAGPGTKATGNRRLTSSSVSSSANVGNGSSASLESGTGARGKQHKQTNYASNSNKPDILPLSSSQSNNQSTSSATGSNAGTGRVRTNSFGNSKSRYASEYDSTLDELPRRSYMSVESSSSNYRSGTMIELSFSKQNAANIPSPFESVIKRFRQRQQQQQLDMQRRQLNRQLRRQQQQQQQNNIIQRKTTPIKSMDNDERKDEESEEKANSNSRTGSGPILDEATGAGTQQDNSKASAACPAEAVMHTKRIKRYSDSIGTMNIDGFRVSTVLDNSIWRKEKVCCGTIFRGLYNEIAIFPKLLKPCEHRMMQLANESTVSDSEKVESPASDEIFEQLPTKSSTNNVVSAVVSHKRMSSPPPRTTKSGSISSCDSNTSGTGSMDGGQALDDYLLAAIQTKKQVVVTPAINRPNILLSSKRQLPTSVQIVQHQISTKRIRTTTDDQSPSSSSGASHSRLSIGNEEDDEIEVDGVNELILEAEIVSETSNDATSSSTESLASVEGKKTGVVKTAVA